MKILFLGPMGAGKTTAIRAISDIDPVVTEAENNDLETHRKATTTVAMDYGEIHLDNGEVVALYGIPGQQRFAFLWPVLAQGSLGAIILLDDRPDQLEQYLNAFPELVARGSIVIGIGHISNPNGKSLEPYQQILRNRDLCLPIFLTDVRDRAKVLLLIESLIANAEVNHLLCEIIHEH